MADEPAPSTSASTTSTFVAPSPFAYAGQEEAGDRELPTLGSSAAGEGGAADAAGLSRSRSGSGSSGEPVTARIVSTSNQLEDEPWLPVKSIVTMFRIHVSCGEKSWEVLRRYTDFNELHAQLAKVFDPAGLPALPPKLLLNDDESIAERYLELDTYLRKLLTAEPTTRHPRLLDFLGVEKQGVRYGVRRYEYDSAQSEGNRYIRDGDL